MRVNACKNSGEAGNAMSGFNFITGGHTKIGSSLNVETVPDGRPT
jgi:hypothetical protein